MRKHTPKPSVLFALTAACLAVAVSLIAARTGTAAKPWPVPKAPLNVRLFGQVTKVVVGRKTSYRLVVTNSQKNTLRAVKVSFTPANLIVKSGVRYKTVRGFYAPSLTANWRLENLRAGTARTIPLTLQFPVGSENQIFGIALEVQALLGASGFDHQGVTIHYKTGP